MNNNIQRILPNNVKIRIPYTGRKLGTKFQIKDITKNQYEHDLIYYSKCPEPNYNEDYLGKLITAEKITNLTYLNVCKLVTTQL